MGDPPQANRTFWRNALVWAWLAGLVAEAGAFAVVAGSDDHLIRVFVVVLASIVIFALLCFSAFALWQIHRIDWHARRPAARAEPVGTPRWAFVWSMVALLAVLIAIPGATVLAVRWLRDSGGFLPEVILPLLVIIGVVGLLTALMAMVAVFARAGLEDKFEALGFPRGTVRAVISLVFILVFITVSVFLFQQLKKGGQDIPDVPESEYQALLEAGQVVAAVPTEFRATVSPSTLSGVTDGQLMTLQELDDSAVTVTVEPAEATDDEEAAGGEVGLTTFDELTPGELETLEATVRDIDPEAAVDANGTVFEVTTGVSEGTEDFADQMLTTLSTLVVALSAFYFGHRAVESARSAVGDAGPPSLRIVKPDRGDPQAPVGSDDAGTLAVEVEHTAGEDVSWSIKNADGLEADAVGTVIKTGPGKFTFTFAATPRPAANATVTFALVNTPSVTDTIEVTDGRTAPNDSGVEDGSFGIVEPTIDPADPKAPTDATGSLEIKLEPTDNISPDPTVNPQTAANVTKGPEDGTYTFGYTPTGAGDVEVTFTRGSDTAPLTVTDGRFRIVNLTPPPADPTADPIPTDDTGKLVIELGPSDNITVTPDSPPGATVPQSPDGTFTFQYIAPRDVAAGTPADVPLTFTRGSDTVALTVTDGRTNP